MPFPTGTTIIEQNEHLSCDSVLRSRVAARLKDFSRQTAEEADLRAAAVALVITAEGDGANLSGIETPRDYSEQAALLLTRRSSKLRNHPGQWAFPGGRLESGESHVQAAMRETSEEIGLDLNEDQLLGFLDDFVTRSGFIMTPVVFWAGCQITLTPDPSEVASIHRIPLVEFLRADAPQLSLAEPGSNPILRMPVGDDHIAAPTAAIIYQFREVCLLGHDTRVAHFEQPEFAWR